MNKANAKLQIPMVEDVQLTCTKLISTKTETTPFRYKFNEVVSPQIEPATESSTAAIDRLLADLGCLGDLKRLPCPLCYLVCAKIS